MSKYPPLVYNSIDHAASLVIVIFTYSSQTGILSVGVLYNLYELQASSCMNFHSDVDIILIENVMERRDSSVLSPTKSK